MIATARVAAFDALREIEARRLDLGEAVARVRKPLTDERDRALLLELVSGTLRMRAAIDFQLASRVSRSLSKLDDAVRLVPQDERVPDPHLSRIPASAVINDAVELTAARASRARPGRERGIARARARPREADLARRASPDAAVEAVAAYLAVVNRIQPGSCRGGLSATGATPPSGGSNSTTTPRRCASCPIARCCRATRSPRAARRRRRDRAHRHARLWAFTS